jgi:hypothetical protein
MCQSRVLCCPTILVPLVYYTGQYSFTREHARPVAVTEKQRLERLMVALSTYFHVFFNVLFLHAPSRNQLRNTIIHLTCPRHLPTMCIWWTPSSTFKYHQHTVLATVEYILKLATTRHLNTTPHLIQINIKNLPQEHLWCDALFHYYPIIFISQ